MLFGPAQKFSFIHVRQIRQINSKNAFNNLQYPLLIGVSLQLFLQYLLRHEFARR